jgi:DNA-binding response OmpR family regulator
MLIDDDRLTVSLLQTLLELDGFEVMQVTSEADIVERALSEPPDAFLVDYHLSDREGAQVVRELREQPRFADAAIVMTSGLDVEEKALAAGADAFLLKPFEPTHLSDLLKRLVNR